MVLGTVYPTSTEFCPERLASSSLPVDPGKSPYTTAFPKRNNRVLVPVSTSSVFPESPNKAGLGPWFSPLQDPLWWESQGWGCRSGTHNWKSHGDLFFSQSEQSLLLSPTSGESSAEISQLAQVCIQMTQKKYWNQRSNRCSQGPCWKCIFHTSLGSISHPRPKCV